MITKFNICDKVYFLNTVTGKIDKEEVKGIRVVPTAMHAEKDGVNVLDAFMVLYETGGPVLSESEVFWSRDEAVAHWKEVFQDADAKGKE